MTKLSLLNGKIEHFLKCAEFESFNAAAFRMGITQAALSKSIKALEDEMGVKLFERSVGGIRLTVKGQALLGKLRRYQSLMQQEISAELHSTRKIALKVGAVPHFANKFLIPEIAKRAHGIAPIQLFVSLSLHVLEAVQSGQLDFGFISWTNVPKGMRFIEVWPDPGGIVGLRSKYSHIRNAKTLDQLKDEPWIYFPKPQYDWGHLLEPDQGGFIVRDQRTNAQLVLGGFGISNMQLDVFSDSELKLLVKSEVNIYSNAKIYAVHGSKLKADARDELEKMIQSLRRLHRR